MCKIETSRLRLRQFAPDDLDELYRIYSHPNLIKYVATEKPLCLEDTKAAINCQVEHWRKYRFGVWAVIHKKHQKLIGHCGLKFLENTPLVQLGYLLLPSYWGRGLGTEAASAVLRYGFEVTKLEKIVAIALPENLASRRVMEKVGMKYEKEAYYYNHNVVFYSISQKAYQSRTQGFKPTTKHEYLSCPIPQILTPVFR